MPEQGSGSMKALSLTQPWATLVAIGAKKIETRSWSTPHRGWLAIHAAKGLGSVGGPSGLIDLCLSEPFQTALAKGGAGLIVPGSDLPLGAVVAVAHLHRVGRIGRRGEDVILNGFDLPIVGDELAFGDYAPGRYGWALTSVWALAEPIPCRGALGLWDVPADVLARIDAEIGVARV